MTWGGE